VKFISLDVESRKLHEARLRAERNYQKKSYEKGLLEGIEKGKQEGLSEGIMKGKLEGLSQGIEKGREEALVESLYLGIELTLESHFNSKGLALLTSVKKIKDIEKLKKILETSIKSSSLDEVKQLLSK
jgi:flagellar biosynthesis/type III secretory pathway protein FliH